MLGPKGNMRVRGFGEAGEGDVVKAKALFRFFKAEFSFLNLAISAETDEGEAGEGAGTGWEAALPRKMLLVDCLTAGSMVVRQAMREVTVLEARVEWVPS